MTHYKIDVTSDIVCPWCYIGHTRLAKAIANHKQTFPDDTFAVAYRPFYLNPPAHTLLDKTMTTPPPPFPTPTVSRADYYNAKFGAARARAVHDAMDRVTAPLGLRFKYGGRTGSSRNGHRLVHHAQTHGGDGGEAAQNAVMHGLWRRYLEEEVDITALETLVEVGVEAGLGSDEEVREFLVSGRGGEEVDRAAGEARAEGVSGVPYFVVQGEWAVEGAQEPRAFEMLFRRWKEMEAKKAEGNGNGNGNGDVQLTGQACGINGEGCD